MYPLKFDANITFRSLVGNIPQDKKYKILNKEDVLFVHVFDFNIKNKKKKICTTQPAQTVWQIGRDGERAARFQHKRRSSGQQGGPCKRLDEAGLFR